MPSDTISIKANNHRIYQCVADKKVELLNQLIAQNSAHKIYVVTSKNGPELQTQLQNRDILVFEDREFVQNKDLVCDLLISFDIPIKAIVYMARVAKASQKAFLLLDESEQQELHGIEMLLGRAIKQEVVEGFEYPRVIVEKPAYSGQKKMSKGEIKDEAKKRYEAKTQDAPKKEYKEKREYKDKKDFKPNKDAKPSDGVWAKKKKAPNKFLGKDENGKALFSGKDGERNHRHDGSSKRNEPQAEGQGRKISIAAMKPKESKE